MLGVGRLNIVNVLNSKLEKQGKVSEMILRLIQNKYERPHEKKRVYNKFQIMSVFNYFSSLDQSSFKSGVNKTV